MFNRKSRDNQKLTRAKNYEHPFTESVHEGLLKFKCDKCEYASATKQNLIKHIEAVHEGQKRQKHYKCKLCAKKFGGPGNLEEHVKYIHKGEKDIRGNIVKSMNNDHQNYKCGLCDETFPTVKSVNDHFDLTHLQD